jgi:hypothetical protein
MNSDRKYTDDDDIDSYSSNRMYSEDMVRLLLSISDDKRYIYSIFHTMMVFVALYLSFRCQKFGHPRDFLEIIAAICCPYIYIMWILMNYGTCSV